MTWTLLRRGFGGSVKSVVEFHALRYVLPSRNDYVTTSQKQKTYGRFLGTIFFGRLVAMQVPENEWLARQRIQEKWKNTKKMIFKRSRPPLFSAKQGHFWVVFGCQTICPLQVVIHQQLARTPSTSKNPNRFGRLRFPAELTEGRGCKRQQQKRALNHGGWLGHGNIRTNAIGKPLAFKVIG